MLIFSHDRKSVVDASFLAVQKNLGGGKDAKFSIAACGEGFGQSALVANFPDEKTAIDALEKIYTAFADGATAYKFE